MKVLVPNYTFDASAQTVTFTDYASITLERVLAVINVTDQVVIYQPNNSAKGASAATNVLTLEFDTTAMDDTDDLMVIYDDITQDYWKKEDAVAASGDAGVPAWAVRKDTPANTAADGDYHPLEVNSTGKLWIAPGSGALDLGKLEDDAHASGDLGVAALAVRRDTPASNAADGDYATLTTDDIGRLRVVTGKIKTVTTTSAGLTTASTAYTAGDMLGTEWTFADVAAIAGGGWEIVSATLLCDVNVLGPTDLFLFNASVAGSDANDNAANSWSDSDMAKCVGVISFPSPTVSALNSIATVPDLGLFGECAADDNLYGGLVTRIGHTFFTATDDITIRLVVRRA